MNRRDFIKSSSSAVAVTAVAPALPIPSSLSSVPLSTQSALVLGKGMGKWMTSTVYPVNQAVIDGDTIYRSTDRIVQGWHCESCEDDTEGVDA